MVISFFYEKNPKITILYWDLVIGFLNLVSVDAKERSDIAIIWFKFEFLIMKFLHIPMPLALHGNKWRGQ